MKIVITLLDPTCVLVQQTSAEVLATALVSTTRFMNKMFLKPIKSYIISTRNCKQCILSWEGHSFWHEASLKYIDLCMWSFHEVVQFIVSG